MHDSSVAPTASQGMPSPPPAASSPTKPKGTRLTRLDPAAFKDDPQIAAALAAFRGRIVQVVAPADGPA